MSISFEDVSIVAAGHVILRQIEARFEAGESIAVLGASGAGKSTFLGLLHGWHRAASGRILADGSPLDGEVLESLRERTAWVEPDVTLWNRSLLDNVRYGDRQRQESMENLCRIADLRSLIEGLPSGLASLLGEDGGWLAGGEGQRIRLARALTRREADLVLLDEASRGLEATSRRALLEEALSWWQGATVLCATHDVASVDLFDRIVVLEAGKIVEIGSPEALRAQPTSHVRKMLDAERRRRHLWSSKRWRRFVMRDGSLSAAGSGGEA